MSNLAKYASPIKTNTERLSAREQFESLRRASGGVSKGTMTITSLETLPEKKRVTKKPKEDTKAYKSETRCSMGRCPNDAANSPFIVQGSILGTLKDYPVCTRCAEETPRVTGTKVIARTVVEAPVQITAIAGSQTLVHICTAVQEWPALCGAVKGLGGLGPTLTPLTVPWYRWCSRCHKKWSKTNDGTAKPARSGARVRKARVESVPSAGKAASSESLGQGGND